jgi:hypothetical protein
MESLLRAKVSKTTFSSAGFRTKPSRRPVPLDAFHFEQSAKANKAVETASDISTFFDTGLKAGVNKIGPGRVAEWQCLDSHAD